MKWTPNATMPSKTSSTGATMEIGSANHSPGLTAMGQITIPCLRPSQTTVLGAGFMREVPLAPHFRSDASITSYRRWPTNHVDWGGLNQSRTAGMSHVIAAGEMATRINIVRSETCGRNVNSVWSHRRTITAHAAKNATNETERGNASDMPSFYPLANSPGYISHSSRRLRLPNHNL